MPVKDAISIGIYTVFQLIGLAIVAVALWVLLNVLSSQPALARASRCIGFHRVDARCRFPDVRSDVELHSSDQAGCSWTRLSGSTFITNFRTWCLLSGASALGFLLLLWIAGRLGMFV